MRPATTLISSWFSTLFPSFSEVRSSPAIRSEDGTVISYEALAFAIESCASQLSRKGVNPGSRVALVPQTDLPSIVSFFAILRIGASPCLLTGRAPRESIPGLLERARISHFFEVKKQSVARVSQREETPCSILLFTSGSSGIPKLVSLPPGAFLTGAVGSNPSLGLDPESGWLLTLPLFHVSGLAVLFRCFTAGSTVLLGDSLKSVATHLSVVPTQLLRMLQQNVSLPKLKALPVGGAPIGESLAKKALAAGFPLRTTYGLTETASQVTLSSETDTLDPFHLGKPLPGRELSIGEEGEIFVKGTTLFAGYDEGSDPELPLTSEGWFGTKDLGRLDSNGNLVYLGRKDNLFISGGENIHPEEIERVLGQIPGILSSVVVPVNDEEFGQRPVAFLHTVSPPPEEAAIRHFLASKIPKFCIPLRFYPLPEFFLEGNKINRKNIIDYAIKIYC